MDRGEDEVIGHYQGHYLDNTRKHRQSYQWMNASMIRRVFPYLSHATVAGAGWALVMAVSDAPSAPLKEISAPGLETRMESTKLHVRKMSTGEGDRLLRDLMEQRDRLDDFRDILPAADRAAAALAAMEALRHNPDDPALLREAAARLAHWLESDPKAAIAGWDTHGGFAYSIGPFNTVLARAAADASIETLLACLHRPPNEGYGHLVVSFGRSPVLLPVLAKALAATASAAKLKEVCSSVQASEGRILFTKAIEDWPGNRLEALAPLLAGSNDAGVLTSYLRCLPNSRQGAWLLAQFGGDVPDDPAQAKLLRSLVNQATALPLQEQIDWLARLDHASGEQGTTSPTPALFVHEQITDYLNRMNWMEDSAVGDWRFRLRHGQISAAVVMAEVRRAMPDAAARLPDLLLRSVFKHVAAHAPEGAMGLLAELPVNDREKLMLESASFSAVAGNPKALLGLVTTLPSHPGSDADKRFRMWVQAANPGVARYGDSYGAWVMALPHGPERDMALSGLAAHLDADDPQTAAAFRAAKTLPDGWKPGP